MELAVLWRVYAIEKKLINTSRVLKTASWMVFNLEEDREGLDMSTLFGPLVLFELDETLCSTIKG